MKNGSKLKVINDRVMVDKQTKLSICFNFLYLLSYLSKFFGFVWWEQEL